MDPIKNKKVRFNASKTVAEAKQSEDLATIYFCRDANRIILNHKDYSGISREELNEAISTASADFKGTFNTLEELQAVENPNNNDYGFVIRTVEPGSTYYDRYKYVENTQTWIYEFSIESTDFTPEQLAALNSGIRKSIGIGSIAEGAIDNLANGKNSHAEGEYNIAEGIGAHAEGRRTKAIGNGAHAEGYNNGSTDWNIAEGYGSHVEGTNTQALGLATHAEGIQTKAKGDYSHAEGYYVQAVGVESHAEGSSTKADGEGSHAEGCNTIANGRFSHAEGMNTVAMGAAAHVSGSYNHPCDRAIFQVGVGSSTNKRDVITIIKGATPAAELNGNIYIINVGGYDGQFPSTGTPSAKSLQEVIAAIQKGLPNDIIRSQTDATIINKDSQNNIINLVYLRAADATNNLAGLMTAADKAKLNEYPGYSTLHAILIGIEDKIPDQASSDNKLADKNFVNSSIATNTATFRGTYTMYEQIPTTGIDNNDYVFLVTTDNVGNTVYKRFKYNANQQAPGWVFEYDLNNSSFTAEQWATIQSGITNILVQKINNLPIKKGTGDQSLISTEGGNVASYKGAVALGKNNGAKQEYTYCFGENNESIGWDSFAIGTSNRILRHMAMAIGRQNTSSAWAGIAIGLGLQTFDNQTDDNNNGEIAIGRYNSPAKDKIFTIGCGTTDNNRKNALEIDVNGKVSFPQENTSITNILQTLNKLVDLTKTITISDGKIPPAYKGNFSTDKFTYTQKGVVLSFANTSVFKLDQATTNYGKVLVATLYQEITQTTPNYLTITAPTGYKISSIALAMRTFSDSYPIGVAFDDASPTQVYATTETPLYRRYATPQSSSILNIVGTDTTGVTAYKWLCFTMFEVELVLDI